MKLSALENWEKLVNGIDFLPCSTKSLVCLRQAGYGHWWGRGGDLELLEVSTPGAYGFVPKDKCIGYTTLSVSCKVALQLRCS